jgi:hypothetical protein
MSVSPVRQQGYPLGIALWGALFVISLPLLPLSVNLIATALERNAPPGILVSTVALVPGAIAICALTGASVFYQARPVPRPLVSTSLVWGLPLVWRAALVVIFVSLGTIFVGIASVGPRPIDLIVMGVLFLLALLLGGRLLVARFEADRWGIRCTNPFTTIRIPWSEVQSLEPRGEAALAQRIVAVTGLGRKRMLWVVDPRVPISRDTARLQVAELEAVRRGATTPRPNGID